VVGISVAFAEVVDEEEAMVEQDSKVVAAEEEEAVVFKKAIEELAEVRIVAVVVVSNEHLMIMPVSQRERSLMNSHIP
jgi:hypothetical protein